MKPTPIHAYALSFAALLALQACQRSAFYSLSPGSGQSQSGATVQLVSGGGGDGTGYEGHIARYIHVDPSRPCPDLGADGKPLPNQEIFVTNLGGTRLTQLVRDGCADLSPPRALKGADLQLSGSGTLTYQGAQFAAQTSPGDFDVVTASCPAGRTPLAAPTRTNLLADSQDLIAPTWIYKPGLAGQLVGSMAGLPGYELFRNNPSYLDDWRRVSQGVTLTAGKTYAATFFAEPGTVSQALWVGYFGSDAMQLFVTFDLLTGTSQVGLNNANISDLSTESRFLAGGLIATVYFTAPAGMGWSSVGITPYNPGYASTASSAVGDSIRATALELEDVATYCQ